MVGYYQSWTNLSLRSLKMGNNADRMGLRRAAKLVFASEWAAKSAIEDYGCDPARISIVPLGANVDAGISEDDALSLIEQRLEPTVRLLLVGVDWQRKGCSFAIEVAQQLRQRAVNVKLDIVGCLPPPGYEVPDFVTCHGFLRKSCPEDVARLRGRGKGVDAMLTLQRLVPPRACVPHCVPPRTPRRPDSHVFAGCCRRPRRRQTKHYRGGEERRH
jgi:glycosyltransferase involved in cell wall biosynthesis